MTTAADRDKAIAKLQAGLAAETAQRISSDAGAMNVVTGAFSDADARFTARLDALERRVAALEGPPAAIPPMPPGARWSKNFADGTLAPFRVLTIPSDPNHVATDPMAKYNRYGGMPAWPDGYARLLSTRRSDGLYASTMIGTTDDGHGGAASHRLRTGLIRFACRMNVGDRTWQTPLWLVGWVDGSWDGTEIDVAEVIGGRLTFNIHIGGEQVYGISVAPPADLATAWHTFGVDITATGVTFLMDEKVVGAWPGKIAHDLAIVCDSKVGIPWESKGPTAATPDPTFADLAWIAEYAA